MRAGIYLRVSTDRQDTENQRPELEQLCEARRWSAELHEEIESGAKVRPVLDELCNQAVRGHVGAIVVWSLDRLGRNAVEVIGRVERLLTANVRLVSIREPWLEQDGPARQLLLFIFAWVAEQERRRLIERTNAGLVKARAAGRIGGRRRADADPSRPELAAKLEEGARLVAGGVSLQKAARQAGVSFSTLRRYILRKG